MTHHEQWEQLPGQLRRPGEFPVPVRQPSHPEPVIRERQSGPGWVEPSRRSIPPVSQQDAELAQRLLQLHWLCEEVAAYLPVGRAPWDRLAELADMLDAITPDVRALVERMVAKGDKEPTD